MSSVSRSAPPVPVGFNRESFFRGIAWLERWELFSGLFTPGGAANWSVADSCAAWQLPGDLAGKRVLVLSVGPGCLGFECERRGANDVVVLGPENPCYSGWQRLKEVLGAQRVRYEQASPYQLDPDKLGSFDLVFCCSLLEQLRYPLLLLDQCRRICRETLYLETTLHTEPTEANSASWHLRRHVANTRAEASWFRPTSLGLREAALSSGFKLEHLSTKNGGQGFFRATIVPGLPEFMTSSTLEGLYSATLLAPFFGRQRLGLGQDHLFVVSVLLASDDFFHRSGSNPEAWLTQVYHHLLGRPPASPELHLGKGRLALLGPTLVERRQSIVLDLLQSTEQRSRLVANYFTRLLGRPATTGEIEHFVQQLQLGTAEEQVLACLLASPEYYNRQGQHTDRWLEQVERDLFGQPKPACTKLAQTLLAQGASRFHLAKVLLTQPGYRQHLVRTYCTLFLQQPEAVGDLQAKLLAAEPRAYQALAA